MARLVIGVDVIGAKNVEALARSIDKANRSLDLWQKISSKGDEGTIVRAVTVLNSAMGKLSATAITARTSMEAFLGGGQQKIVSLAFAQAQAIKQLESSYNNYISTLAKQELMSSKAAQGLAARTAAINANVKAFEKLKGMGEVSGAFDKNTDYSYNLSELKKIESLNAKIAAKEAEISKMKVRNEAEVVSALKAEEAARRSVADATIRQFESQQRLKGKSLITSPADLDKAQQKAETARLSELKKIESLNAKIAAKEAEISKMKVRNEAEVVSALKAEEAARRSVADATIRQFESQQKLRGTTLKSMSGSDKAFTVHQSPVSKESISDTTRLVGQTNKLGQAWDNAAKKSSLFHNVLRGASGAMGGLWLTYGQLLPMLAGFAATAATMKTLNVGSDFDYTARSIDILSIGYETLSKNADLAAKSLEVTKAAILGIEDSVFTAGDLAKGILEFARADYKDLEENIKGVEAASRFAYIGQMDMAKSIELVVGQMSAFKNLKADEAYNTMAVVADKTSVDLQQMADAYKNATSLGTVMGLEFNDVAVALGVLGQAGIRGATAGAALNTMMYKLVAPTKKARDEMHALGIEFNAFDRYGKMKSIKTIAFDLANMTKGLKANEVARVFESMVGLRGVKALGALVSMARDSADQFNELSEAVKNSGTYLEGYFNLLEKSGKVQIDMLKADFDRMFTRAYQGAEPEIVDGIISLRNLVKDPALSNGLATITSTIMAMVKIAADGVSALVDFGASIPGAGAGWKVTLVVLSGIANKMQQIADLARESAKQAKEKESRYNPFLAWEEYSKSVDNLFSGKAIKDSMAEQALSIEKIKNMAEDAKKSLVQLNGVDFKVNVEEADKLQRVDEYFTNILERVVSINQTPLEIVNAKVEADAASMYTQLVQSGMALNDMVAYTDSLVEQMGRLGNGGSNAAKKIEGLADELVKAGGDKALIEKLTANFERLSKAANQKEIAKANKEMISGMVKNWQDYADKVIDIQESLADSQRSLARDLRAIDQSNMSGMQLWNDKKREAEEYKQAAIEAGRKASEAFKSGDKVTGESQYKMAQEYLKEAAAAAKDLNTEVTASTSKQDAMVKGYENALKILKANKVTLEATGKDTRYVDAYIKRYESLVAVVNAQRDKSDATVLLTKPQGGEEAKRILKELYEAEVKLKQEIQSNIAAQMEVEKKRAEVAGGGPVDMTKGMDEAKAKYIANWLEANQKVKEEVSNTSQVAIAYFAKVQMPSEAWKNSIFNMKGVFAQAVDEMATKLNSEFNSEKVQLKLTNITDGNLPDQAKQLFEGVKIASTGAADQSFKVWTDKWNEWKTAGAGATQFLATELNKLTVLQNQVMKGGGTAATEAEMTAIKNNIQSILQQMSVVHEDTISKTKDMSKANADFVDLYKKGWVDAADTAISKVKDIYAELKNLTDRSWDVNVNVTQGRSNGGLIRGFQHGGYLQGLASGGTVKNVMGGAYLPGFGGGDRRLLYGEDGEFMINKWAVKAGGVDTASAYNAGDFDTVIKNLSERTSRTAPESGRRDSQDFSQVVVWKFADTGETAKIKTTAMDLGIIERGLKRKARLSS